MEWSKQFDINHEPGFEEIGGFVKSPLWQSLNSYLQTSYHIQPKLAYSSCSMQPGWNVKYRKGARSLYTLYPMLGYFIALVVIGDKERTEIELLLATYSGYVQSLYHNTSSSGGSRWLMINVTQPQIYDDVIRLVQIRAKQK